MVVARCPRCHGWTMFHAEAQSATGREWIALAKRDGDLITTYDPGIDVDLGGKACLDAEGKPASERTCAITWTESAWSPYA